MKRFRSWIENYWYHYKWVTIISVFFAVALIICLLQCSTKEEYDAYTLYAGPCYIGAEQSSQLADAVNDHMDADRQKVCINSFVYVSEDMKDKYKEHDAYVNEGINMQQTSDFFDFLYTASFNILILDGELYSRIEKDEILTRICDISQSAIDHSPDGYCVRLHDTSLPDKYSIFSDMPEDTVLCFRKNVLLQNAASKNNAQRHEYEKTVFRKLIEQ